MADALSDLSRQLGDRYLIERELGRGGMGAVYLARDRRLDRPVALKVLPEEYASQPDLRERFLRETRMAAGFSHPNIVPVFAIEETEHVLAFAMGFVEGESVASRVARDGPLNRRDAVRLLQDVSYALAYAHGRGVVHRDIKPDNIMIERATGRALVMDFGIARAITPVVDKPGLTRVGEVVGTPEYMSPEQAAGESVDGRADLYSLGLVAWFAMSGRTAVTGESTQRILVKQLTEAIPPLASVRSDLPASLCDVVDRCCAKEADDRYANAEAVVEALDATQLATPDVPVAMRLLAPELTGAVVRAVVAAVLLTYGAITIVRSSNGNGFSAGVIAAALAWVSTLSGLREIRRLRGSGYSVEQLQRLLKLTLQERDEERARRRTDTALVRRRRIRVALAFVILVTQVFALASMLSGVRAGDGAKFSGTKALVIFFASLLSGAMAVAILASSPFRRSLSEQLFSAVWLGAIGRRLMQWSGSSKVGTSNAAPQHAISQATRAPVTPAGAAGGTASRREVSLDLLAADVTSLRARVDALESRGTT
jgi:eukaryotic-like serine/threonine-protein kinase